MSELEEETSAGADETIIDRETGEVVFDREMGARRPLSAENRDNSGGGGK